MPTRMNRSTVIVMSQNDTGYRGSSTGGKMSLDEYRMTAAAWRMMRIPRVATTLASGAARRSCRMTSRWERAPNRADAPTPMNNASRNGCSPGNGDHIR